MKNNLPDFIIIGAQKAGTSALHYYLNQHPDIYMARRKDTNSREIAFFDKDENYKKGINWYLYQLSIKDNDTVKLVGEKTPEYLYVPHVPERIHKYNPNIKIVCILRNPVDRAYSNYWHEVKKGREKLSFKRAIKIENKRIKKSYQDFVNYSYINKGFYHIYINRYLEYFNYDQVLFILFEDLKNNPQSVANQCFDFLGLENCDISTDSIQNETTLYKYNIIVPFINSILEVKYIKKIYKKTNLLYIKNWLLAKKKYKKIDDSLRKELSKLYYEHNIKLEKITGLNLSEWYKI